MPGIYVRDIQDRRRFLQIAGGAGCFALLPKPGSGQEEAEEKEIQSVRWALLADTHVAADKNEVYRGSYPFKNLETAVGQVKEAAPSAAVIVGDVSRLDGQEADYAVVKGLLKPLAKETPVFMGLGNHDDRVNFLKVFPDNVEAGKRQKVTNKHVLVVDQSPVVRIVLLDSLHRVNQAAGSLGNAQLAWLKSYLDTPNEAPVVICVHHTLGRGGSDIQDVTKLFQLVDGAKSVKAICFGHSHRYSFTERKGIHLINLPPVGYRFDGVTPLGWLETKFTAQGALVKLRMLKAGAKGDGDVKSLKWR